MCPVIAFLAICSISSVLAVLTLCSVLPAISTDLLRTGISALPAAFFCLACFFLPTSLVSLVFCFRAALPVLPGTSLLAICVFRSVALLPVKTVLTIIPIVSFVLVAALRSVIAAAAILAATPVIAVAAVLTIVSAVAVAAILAVCSAVSVVTILAICSAAVLTFCSVIAVSTILTVRTVPAVLPFYYGITFIWLLTIIFLMFYTVSCIFGADSRTFCVYYICGRFAYSSHQCSFYPIYHRFSC